MSSPKPAEQDGEYLHEAHAVIADAFAAIGFEDSLNMATWVLDALAKAGWHLLNAEDAEKMLAAYVSESLRYGRYTVTEGAGEGQ